MFKICILMMVFACTGFGSPVCRDASCVPDDKKPTDLQTADSFYNLVYYPQQSVSQQYQIVTDHAPGYIPLSPALPLSYSSVPLYQPLNYYPVSVVPHVTIVKKDNDDKKGKNVVQEKEEGESKGGEQQVTQYIPIAPNAISPNWQVPFYGNFPVVPQYIPVSPGNRRDRKGGRKGGNDDDDDRKSDKDDKKDDDDKKGKDDDDDAKADQRPSSAVSVKATAAVQSGPKSEKKEKKSPDTLVSAPVANSDIGFDASS